MEALKSFHAVFVLATGAITHFGLVQVPKGKYWSAGAQAI